MKFTEIPLKGAYIIETEPFRDKRGLFARTYCKREFQEIGHNKDFVQFNHSATTQKGTLRGMHYQVPPSAEIKLIRCVSGKVYDVIVDIRFQSPTFLRCYGVELDEENMRMIYVPEGFAHGFQTLEDNTQLIYHHTQYYDPANERGIRYNDPSIAIEWPLEPVNVTDKDKSYPLIDNNFKGIKI
jgi:dTDP-4-dehydrorhamnose 3,5-epimerase